MKASRVSIVKVTRTPGMLLRRLYLVRFMEDTNGKIKKANVAWQTGRAHEGRGAEDAAREAELPTMSQKTWQAENLNVLLGRTRLATVAPFPACPRTAVLRLALCPSLSRVSPFTFVLSRLHSIAIFSVHTIQALCFSKNFFESHFLLSFSPWTVSRAKFPVPDDDGFKLFTSLVPCASHSPSNSTQIQERLGRRLYTITWWICLTRSFLPIAWTAWHNSCGKKFYWGLRRHFHWPLRALGLKFSPKYTKCRRNLISWNRSMENLAQVNANGHGLNNDLGQDCQGLWNCWRNGQWCSNWFGGWICAGACQLGGYWRTWCSSFSKQTGSSICRQLFSTQQDSTHTEVGSLQEARGGWSACTKIFFQDIL